MRERERENDNQRKKEMENRRLGWEEERREERIEEGWERTKQWRQDRNKHMTNAIAFVFNVVANATRVQHPPRMHIIPI